MFADISSFPCMLIIYFCIYFDKINKFILWLSQVTARSGDVTRFARGFFTPFFTKIFAFFTPKFMIFLTLKFLFFTPKCYTKNFAFFCTKNVVLVTPFLLDPVG